MQRPAQLALVERLDTTIAEQVLSCRRARTLLLKTLSRRATPQHPAIPETWFANEAAMRALFDAVRMQARSLAAFSVQSKQHAALHALLRQRADTIVQRAAEVATAARTLSDAARDSDVAALADQAVRRLCCPHLWHFVSATFG
jgi:hypothetical protein